MTQSAAIDGSHGARIRDAIILAGLALWREGGASSVTAGRIGTRVQLSRQAVLYHYGSADALREAVGRAAIERHDADVVRQMITARHPLCDGMTGDEKAGWLAGC